MQLGRVSRQSAVEPIAHHTSPPRMRRRGVSHQRSRRVTIRQQLAVLRPTSRACRHSESVNSCCSSSQQTDCCRADAKSPNCCRNGKRTRWTPDEKRPYSTCKRMLEMLHNSTDMKNSNCSSSRCAWTKVRSRTQRRPQNRSSSMRRSCNDVCSVNHCHNGARCILCRSARGRIHGYSIRVRRNYCRTSHCPRG